MRRTDRIASSLAGMTQSTRSGSQFVSVIATIGISSRRASATAIDSRCGSTMKTAPGRRRILRMPPRAASSFVISSLSFEASFFVRRSNSPASRRASRASRRWMRRLIVMKFVSIPPSQRVLTKCWPERAAASAIDSCACFFVPTKRIAVATTHRLADELERIVEPGDGLGQVDDVDPVALGEDVGPHLRVPAPGLMPEVDARFEQLLHAGGSHVVIPPVVPPPDVTFPESTRATAAGTDDQRDRSSVCDGNRLRADARAGRKYSSGAPIGPPGPQHRTGTAPRRYRSTPQVLPSYLDPPGPVSSIAVQRAIRDARS